jgi:hypothetical protein
MANFRIYRTIPSAVRAIRLHPLNLKRVAQRCNGIVVEDQESKTYSGIEIENQFGRKVRVPLGWFIVIRHAKDGGGFAAYSPEDFQDRYE